MQDMQSIEKVAEKFPQLPDDMKSKIAWYLLGRQEEQEKHKLTQKIKDSAVSA